MYQRFGTLFLCLVLSSHNSQELSEQCKPVGCLEPDCPTVSCANGQCDDLGGCVCDSCWSGPVCDVYDNKFKPEFTVTKYSESIKPSTPSRVPVVQLQVTDLDTWDTCQSPDRCACAELEFVIVSGNDDNLFEIQQSTGNIITNEGLFLHGGRDYDLEVAVGNRLPQDARAYQEDDISSWSRAFVRVHVMSLSELEAEMNAMDDLLSEGYNQWGEQAEQAHHRVRRAAVAIPDNVTFTLHKTGDYENITEMRVGSKIHFKLDVHFPAGTTDMLVELFTPDNDTTVMVLCGAKITHVGTNLDTVKENVPVNLEAKDSSTQYDRAVLDFGNVTNSGSDSANDYNSMIFIEWDAVMIDNSDTVNGSTYWVSAGAEYNSEYEVWIGQAAFVTIVDDYAPPELPTFNMTGPDEVQIGSSAVYRLDMYLPYPSIYLAFDAFAPLNTTDEVMSVCSVVLVDTAVNYDCLEKDRFNNDLFARDSGKGNDRGRLDIGTVTNKGVWETNNPWENNRISVEFVMYVYDDEDFIGKDYWIGAAVELGTDKIWAGQMQISVINKTELTSINGTPTFEFDTVNSNTAAMFQPVVYELTMNLPEDSVADYELEILMPFNDSYARMRICDVTLTYQGANIPCATESEPEYLSRDLTGVNDRVVWKLGKLQNTGHKSTALDPDANKVKFTIVGSVLNHTLNQVGEQMWTSIGVSYASVMYIGMVAVDVIAGSAENATAPSFSLAYPIGDDQIHVGASVEVSFTIATVAGEMYSPMDIEFMLPFENDSAVISLCRAEVTYVGKNMPCSDRVELNKTVEYVSRSDDDTYTKAVFSLDTVCNIRDANTSVEHPDDDVMKFSFVIRVEDHPYLEHGDKKWVSAGVMYSETQMWVGQLALYAQKDQAITPPATPHLEVYRHDDNTSNDVPQGRAAIVATVIKLPPLATMSLKLVAYTSDTSLSICTVYFDAAGWGLPCVNKKTATGNATEQHAGTAINSRVEFDLGAVSNVANDSLEADNVFDNNTIRLHVIVQTDAAATVASTHTVNFDLEYGAVSPLTTNLVLTTVDATLNNVTDNTTIPEFDFSVISMADNSSGSHNVAKGEAIRFHMDISPAQMTDHRLTVKFLTPVNETGVMEICDVNVIYVGRNLPCHSKKMFDAVYEERTGSDYTDIGSIDLGHLCHFPLEDDEEEDKIRIEAIAKITRQNSLSTGDKVWFSSTVKVNDNQIYVTQLGLVVVDDSQFNDTAYNDTEVDMFVNVTTSPTPMRPGGLYTFPLVGTVPANCSVAGSVHIKTPIDQTAVMTVNRITLLRAGANLACMGKRPDEDFNLTLVSTQDTTQMDDATYDLGFVSNTGVTYRMDTMKPEDNQFVVELEVQFADSVGNVQASTHNVDIKLTLGMTESVTIASGQVTRDNLEKPDLELDADVNTTLSSDTEITIDCILRHTNESSAEGYNVTVSFYYPPYVSFSELVSINVTAPEITNTTLAHGVQFKFASLFFTDIAAFTFEVKSTTADNLPVGLSEANATTPYEAGCNMIHRTNHPDPPETFYITRLTSLSFKIVPPGLSDDCVASPLGMESGHVQDCQMTSSHSPSVSESVYQVRQGGSSGWTPGVRRGQFMPYIQVYFGNSTLVTQVALEHPGMNSRVTSYDLQYSDDGLEWTTGETVVPSASYSVSLNPLSFPMAARYLRLVVTGKDGGQDAVTSLKVEFYGCVKSSDVNDACQRPNVWEDYASSEATALYNRGFLVTGSTMYYCDYVSQESKEMKCYTTSDGVAWQTLDEGVVNILGYFPDEDELYGLAWDKQSFVVSSDSGETWMFVSQDRYAEVSAEGSYIPAKDVPWLHDAKLQPGTDPDVDYTMGSWGANFEGMYRNSGSWVKVTDWTACCN